MDILQAVILGFVQAVTEWLPLSSKTMDTFVFTQFFGGKPEQVISMLLYLHVGTLLAATIYFRDEIIRLASKFVSQKSVASHANGKIGFLFTALLLTGVVGIPLLALEHYVLPNLDGGALLSVMGAGLIATGFILTMQHKNRWRNAESAGWRDGMLTGAIQGLSVLPGVSRAGSTTAALLWRGFNAESAFHLSFLLSIPTMVAAELLLYAAQGGILAMPLEQGILLSASSFIFGYLTIGILLKIAHRINVASLAFLFGIMMIAFGLSGLS